MKFPQIWVLFLSVLATPALAESWVAKCQNLHFKFDRAKHRSYVYMKTSNGVFQISQGEITFDNGVAMRSPLSGIPDGISGPMSEVGLNRSRSIVYVLYRNPNTGQLKDGVFCETPITAEP